MGIDKPYVVERDALAAPPGPPHALDLPARVDALIQPTSDGVSVAGHSLRVPFEVGAEAAARTLREAVVQRFRQRRPHADDVTWRHFEGAARAAARSAVLADEDLRHALTAAIDGL